MSDSRFNLDALYKTLDLLASPPDGVGPEVIASLKAEVREAIQAPGFDCDEPLFFGLLGLGDVDILRVLFARLREAGPLNDRLNQAGPGGYYPLAAVTSQDLEDLYRQYGARLFDEAGKYRLRVSMPPLEAALEIGNVFYASRILQTSPDDALMPFNSMYPLSRLIGRGMCGAMNDIFADLCRRPRVIEVCEREAAYVAEQTDNVEALTRLCAAGARPSKPTIFRLVEKGKLPLLRAVFPTDAALRAFMLKPANTLGGENLLSAAVKHNQGEMVEVLARAGAVDIFGGVVAVSENHRYWDMEGDEIDGNWGMNILAWAVEDFTQQDEELDDELDDEQVKILICLFGYNKHARPIICTDTFYLKSICSGVLRLCEQPQPPTGLRLAAALPELRAGLAEACALADPMFTVSNEVACKVWGLAAIADTVPSPASSIKYVSMFARHIWRPEFHYHKLSPEALRNAAVAALALARMGERTGWGRMPLELLCLTFELCANAMWDRRPGLLAHLVEADAGQEVAKGCRP